MKLLLLILKNVRRNMLRTLLTAMGTMVLVLVVTMVWSILALVDKVTTARSQNFKAIVTERWQIPSQMPYTYVAALEKFAWHRDEREKLEDPRANFMTWSFYGGTIDPVNRTFENMLFAFALEPKSMYQMMDDMDELPASERAALVALAEKMEKNRDSIVVGPGRLKMLNKQVGDRIKISSFNFKGIDLEFTIIGTAPPGRYDLSSFINREYLNNSLDAWKKEHNGQDHEMANRSLGLVWLSFPDSETFARTAEEIEQSSEFSNPSVKIEAASSGIAAFLESYRDLLWGMRFLLAPAVMVTLALVIANSISISVRERRQEIAVLKVLGFLPRHILILVLGEAVLLGAVAGGASVLAIYLVVNTYMHGVPFPIAFFPRFFIPPALLFWGPAVGGGTALVGAFLPAWNARSVKVSEVFAKIA